MRIHPKFLLVFGAAAILAACGHGTEQRAATGAGSGAVAGAVVGGPIGAVVGAAVGGAGGTAVSKEEDASAR
jgi:osmotically inducible lipoprotein OsmB